MVKKNEKEKYVFNLSISKDDYVKLGSDKNIELLGGINKDDFIDEMQNSQEKFKLDDKNFIYNNSTNKSNYTDTLIEYILDGMDYFQNKKKQHQYEMMKKDYAKNRSRYLNKISKQHHLSNSQLYNSLNNKKSDMFKFTSNSEFPKIKFASNGQEELLIKKKQKTLIEEEIANNAKIERRANLFYDPNEDEEAKKYFEDKKAKKKKKEDEYLDILTDTNDKPSMFDKPVLNIDVSSKMKELSQSKYIRIALRIFDFTFSDKKYLKDSYEYAIKNPEETIKSLSTLFEDSKKNHAIDNLVAVNFIQNDGIRNYAVGEKGKEAAENLYMAKKEYYMNTSYAKEHLLFSNCYELESELKEYFMKKISDQIGSDKLNETRGIYISADSDSSKKLAENTDLLSIVSKNLTSIKKGSFVNDSVAFTDENFYHALHNADILNMHINKQGNVDLLITDVYDFNDEKKSSDLIKLAREHQLRGDLIPYFIVYRVVIPKSKIPKLNKN